ncbi:MAG: isopentenyl-diphosphate Delta-isomerase [Opitutaceae bacterium]
MEQVILVDTQDRPMGVMSKLEAHLNGGRLHRALSVFLMNTEGELLLQRRALEKYHFPGLWSNTCCTHPRPGESTRAAAVRRLSEEMGIICDLEPAFVFRYEADCESGLTEREVDHVFSGTYSGPVDPDPGEVADYRWIPLEALADQVADEPFLFTPWLRIALPRVRRFLRSASSTSVLSIP